MNAVLSSGLLFLAGLGLVIFFAERLVKGVVQTSLGFGISAFIISVVFIGFDPENLAVGAAGTFEGISGIALGSIIGAAMVAIALAFGITAMIAPMKFEQVPRQVLFTPILAVLIMGTLGLDGQLSRLDGVILLAAFGGSVGYFLWLSRRGLDIKPGGEVVGLNIQSGMLERLRVRAANSNITNLPTVLGDATQPHFPPDSFDVIFLCTVLGEIPDRTAALQQAYRALKPGGRLSITEIFPDPHYQPRAVVQQLA